MPWYELMIIGAVIANAIDLADYLRRGIPIPHHMHVLNSLLVGALLAAHYGVTR